MEKLQYRADIDGLRAIAILLVVGYHAGLPGFDAGFIGVDIFFVISGYLITALLLKEIEAHNRISLLDFYGRRVRRLMPALLIVLGATLLLGYVLLPPIGQLQDLGLSAIASLAFVANYYFMATTGGYFDAPSEQAPLLHLWSIAVEEQFYALWPLLLVALVWLAGAHRTRRRPLMLWVAIGIGLASLGYSILQTGIGDQGVYFSTPARAWQLMTGALLALGTGLHRPGLSSRRQRSLLLLAVLSFAAALLIIDASDAYPGYLAILPVVAASAVLVLGAARTHWLSALLSRSGIVHLGKISYPWYLWHWPLLALYRDYAFGEPVLELNLLLAGISLLLAHLTYTLIERPVWRRIRIHGITSPRLIRAALIGGACVGTAALAVTTAAEQRKANGLYHQLARAVEDVPRLREACHLSAPFRGLPAREHCTVEALPPQILLWGDSHADHYSPTFEAFQKVTGVDFLHRSFSACRPLLGFKESRYSDARNRECRRFNRAVVNELRILKARGLQGVALGLAWLEIPEADQQRALEGLARTVGILLRHDLRVVIFLPTPVFPHPMVACLARKSPEFCAQPAPGSDARTEALTRALRTAYARQPRVKMLDIRQHTCNENGCGPLLGDTVVFRDE